MLVVGDIGLGPELPDRGKLGFWDALLPLRPPPPPEGEPEWGVDGVYSRLEASGARDGLWYEIIYYFDYA